MSLSRPQQIMLKRAQQEAALSDSEYREAIATVFGAQDCRSSIDPRLTDEHLDRLMSYFEAIFWQKLYRHEVQKSPNPRALFRAPKYWATRNQRGYTSRDRYTESQLMEDILDLEEKLATHGCSPAYLAGIRAKISPFDLVHYRAALNRTLRAKSREECIKPN